MKTRLGVVGLGLIWEHIHAPILEELRDWFEIKALCARNIETVERFQSHYPDAKAFVDYRELMRCGEIDAALCATPISMNAPVTLEALKQGINVFVEKPPALSYEDLVKMQESSKETGASVTVLEQAVYSSQAAATQKVLRAKRLGTCVCWEKVSHYPIEQAGAYANTAWRNEADFPLGLILDGGYHDIAQLLMLFGMPEGLLAHGRTLREGYGKYDHIQTMFKYRDDMCGTFSYSSYLPAHENRFVIRGTEGTLQVLDNKLRLELAGRETQDIAFSESNAYRDMWMALVKGGEPRFSLEDAAHAERLFEAMQHSIETGQMQTVQEGVRR